MLTFAKRCVKEILRDPLNLAFGLGFPVVLLLMLSVIQSNVPVSLFEIASLTPGITVFGLSFMTLFSATLLARDRESSFLQRLYTTPMKAKDFSRLPPAFVEVAEFDCLHDDGVLYARLLSDAGIEVEFHEANGTMHGFDTVFNAPTSQKMIAKRIAYMKRMFKEK
jgi:acetyl esterase/lipase